MARARSTRAIISTALAIASISANSSFIAAAEAPSAAAPSAELKAQADALKRQQKYAEAEPLLRRLLAIRIAGSGESDPDTAGSYDDLGENLRAQRRFADALPLHRRALDIRRQRFGEKHLWTAFSYDQLADTFYEAGRYAEAETQVRKALDIRRGLLGENDRRTVDSYLHLAIALDLQGRYSEAEPVFRKVLDISLAAFGERDRLTAQAYSGLATCLFHQGRTTEVGPLTQKALEINLALDGRNSTAVADSYHHIADELQVQDRIKEAEPYYRKVLDIYLAAFGERHPDTARGYIDVAVNLSQQGRYSEAEPLYHKGLEINRAILGEMHQSTAYSYAGLAYQLELQKRFAEAEPLRRKVLAINSAVLGEDHPDLSRDYWDLASDVKRQGRLAEAEAIAAKSVDILRSARRMLSKSLAPSRASRSIGIDSNVLFGNYLSLAWDLGHPSAGFDAREDARALASAFMVAQDLINSPSGNAIIGAAARTAGGSDKLAQLARQEQDLASGVGKLDQDLMGSFARNDAAMAQRLRGEFAATAARLTAVTQQIDKEFPAYRELVSPEPLALKDARRLMAPDEGLLLLLATNQAIYSFAVGPHGQSWSRVSGDVAAVYGQIAKLRCEVDDATCSAEQQAARDAIPLTKSEQQGHARFDLATANALYRELVAGVEDALAGVKRLYVTQSGALGDLPLAMLVTAPPLAGTDVADPEVLKSAPWLADRYALTTLPAVSALRLKRSLKTGGDTFRGYGDPIFSGNGAKSRGGSFFGARSSDGLRLADPSMLNTLPPLPGTKVELTAMAKLLGARPDELRLGAQATESALRADPKLKDASVVAFATHGLLPNPKAAMDEPGLVFTPPAAASDQDDGILTASEASTLSLNAEWVILSACNTASTEAGAGGGDSLSALSRAFLYAGAYSLLASHWRVSDAATAVLTVETLAARKANPHLSRAKALQQSMRTVRTGKHADGSAVDGWTPDWTHPSAWAPFTHIANRDQ